MAIGDDFSVAVNGNIRHESGSTTYTVLELHRWLQDLADNATSTGDDNMDITDATPSERSTDNIVTLNSPYNIDDDAAEYLYDGSITQASGDTVYSGLVVVGSVESGTQLEVIQNNALLTNYWGTGLNADAGANILYRLMIKTRDAGSDIDGKRLRVQAREFGDTYAEFSLTAGLGNTTAALFTSSDLNNQTAQGTVAAWGITNTEGYQQIDVDGDSTDEDYYSKWDLGVQTDINDLYEFTKNIQRRGTAETIHGVNGSLFRGITHQWNYDNEASGPFSEDELLTWTGGGEAILLALDDNGATGTMWVQVTKGVAPSDGDTITGGTSSATCDVDGSVTSRTVSPEFVGASTGSALIGAFGIGVDTGDLSSADQLFDLTNTLRVPPNNVTFTVSGLVSGEDYVLVGNDDTGLDTDQFGIKAASALTTDNITSVSIDATIPADTPPTGHIRVYDNNGVARKLHYSSYTGDTFTIDTTDGNEDFATVNADVGNDVFISYIDELATGTTATFTATQNSSRTMFVRVRDGGAGSPIKTFEATATYGTAGGSLAAIRTPDA